MKRYGVLGLLLLSIWLTVLPSARAADDELQPMSLLLLSKTTQTTGGTGGSYSFAITAIASWTATADASWISVRTASGTGNGTVSYTVSACPDTVAYREGTITIKIGIRTAKLTVQQTNVVWPVADSSGTVQYNNASGLNTANDLEVTINKRKYAGKGKVVTGLGDVTSFYGARVTSTNSTYYRHWAIDIDVGADTNMIARAAMSGVVSAVGSDIKEKGNYVYIKHQIVKNGVTTTLYTRYLHLKSYSVSVGTVVETGQKIGIVGETGSANGDPHLHFAILKTVGGKNYYLNPVPYYHGSDDRGVKYTDSNTKPKENENNPMFVVSGGKWVPNPNWEPVYSSFTGTTSAFYGAYMNALREEGTIAWSVE